MQESRSKACSKRRAIAVPNLIQELIRFRGQPFNFWRGGGGLGDFEKKKILQVHMRKKKIPAQGYCPKKIHARTVGWKKKFWQDVRWVDTKILESGLG